MRADTERAGISVSAPVLTRDGLVPVARFLLDCAAAIAGTPTDEQLAFVHAGRRALLAGQRWVQFEQVLTHRPETWRYVELRDMATRLLGDGLATEFFFMHKPPGLRVPVRARGRPPRRADRRRAGMARAGRRPHVLL